MVDHRSLRPRAFACALVLAGCGAAATPPPGAPQAVSVAVIPESAALRFGQGAQFAAAVTGVADLSVTWKVGEGAAGGSVDGTGRYTAPATAGTYHVIATSHADPTISGSATLTVTAAGPAVSVAVAPKAAAVAVGQTVQFTATVSGSADTSVSWTVQEGAAGGGIGSTGLYTPPSAAGTFHVVARSHADPAQSDIATVVVSAPGVCGADACPAPKGGLTWECEKRFAYGANWAWRSFGADFGGVKAWSQVGVSQAATQYGADLAKIKAAGVSVVRWWMFPRLFTDSITFGSDDAPSGIGGTLVADVQKALELAEQNDVYIMLTLFSFDTFTPTRTDSGVRTPGLQPIAIDAAKRKKLLDNLVAPVARAVEASPYKRRMIAWDMINEPEWAVTGANKYGGDAFTPQSGLQTVTHAQMETFLSETAATLHANCGALVSVGSAAIKWASAWTHLDVDFYQLHYYDWVYEWFPYTTFTLQSAGLTGKPVVMGEFPDDGLSAVGGNPARTVAQLSADLWNQGYAGALSWAYNDAAFPWSAASIKAFPDQHACETKF